MNTLKSLNLGVRGWLLLFYQFVAFVAMSAFTNFPLNMLADMYGGAQKISMLYTAGTLVAIVVQLILSAFVGRIKNIKALGNLLGIVSMVFILMIMLLPPSMQTAVADLLFYCLSDSSYVGNFYGRYSGGTVVSHKKKELLWV